MQTELPILTKKQKVAIRSFITCEPQNVLLELDLSAAEAWIVAHKIDSPIMREQLAHGDLHLYSAMMIYQRSDLTKADKMERYMGKKMNHSNNYRAGAEMVATGINKEGGFTVSVRQVRIWWDRWHAAFNIKPWWDDIEYKLRRDNGTLVTAYGKKRKFWGWINNDLLKAATAFEPQSVVSYHMDGAVHPDLGVRGGLLEIQRQITKPSNNEIKLINTSHDSVLIECPRLISLEIAQRCKELLTRPLVVNGHTFTIPVDCERYDRRWKEDGESLVDGSFVRAKV
jgi:DNA polymerase I-like protein with 3'-5' exonuclease and polymerase domains